MKIEDYDGFYFVPGENLDEMNITYYKFKESYSSPAVENTSAGDKYHIAFFKYNHEGDMIFDDEFEAILTEPSVYVKNLIGTNLFGCIMRKTQNSPNIWEEYLKKFMSSLNLDRDALKMEKKI